MGLSFVSGINLYATVLTVGLGIHFDFISIPQYASELAILGHPYVLMAAGAAYVMEFFADKIPWVDNLWDSFHTFIRPVGAALVSMKTMGTIDPAAELSLGILCGGVAFLSHTTKASARFVVNHSPEPFSNIGLSLAEDVGVIAGSWAAFQHPEVMLGLTLFFVAAFMFLAPKSFRLIRVEALAVSSLFRKISGGSPDTPILLDDIPERFFREIQKDSGSEKTAFCIRCVSGKGAEPGKNRVGYLYMTKDRLSFITRKNFRVCKVSFDISDINDLKFYRKRLLDQVVFSYGKHKIYFHLFKDQQNRGQKISELLGAARGSVCQESSALIRNDGYNPWLSPDC